MDFAFSEEQEMLRASAREFLGTRYPPDRIAAIADGDGFDRSEWPALAEMGWIGISIPESDGGAGLSFINEIVLSEEMGRCLYPGPFFSGLVALAALERAAADDWIGSILSGQRVATVAWAGEDGRFDLDPFPKIGWDPSNGDGRLTGTKAFVPDVAVADLLVVLGHHDDVDAVWLAERDQDEVTWRDLPTVDSTRRMGEVTFEAARPHARP